MDADKATDCMLDEKNYGTAIAGRMSDSLNFGDVSLSSMEQDSYVRMEAFRDITNMIVREVKYLAQQEGIDEEDFWEDMKDEVNSRPSDLELKDLRNSGE